MQKLSKKHAEELRKKGTLSGMSFTFFNNESMNKDVRNETSRLINRLKGSWRLNISQDVNYLISSSTLYQKCENMRVEDIIKTSNISLYMRKAVIELYTKELQRLKIQIP